jgi:hypothetical protein
MTCPNMAKTSFTSVGSLADSWSHEHRLLIDICTPPHYTRADAGHQVSLPGRPRA